MIWNKQLYTDIAKVDIGYMVTLPAVPQGWVSEIQIDVCLQIDVVHWVGRAIEYLILGRCAVAVRALSAGAGDPVPLRFT